MQSYLLGVDGVEGENQEVIEADADVNYAPTVENVEITDIEVLDGENTITGQLVAADINLGDTHNFAIVDGSLNVTTPDGVSIDGLEIALNPDGTFSIVGGFDALAAGEEATITFSYFAVDNLGAASDPAVVTLELLGTNDQPVVTDVSITQAEAPVGVNTFSGTLPDAQDDDVNDTHTYELIDGSLSVSNGLATGVSVIVNADGTYTLTGDFNALAVGESATISFQYIADDGRGFDGTDGENESSISEPATVTLTITGTNDGPVALPDTAITNENSAITVDVLANDSDPDSTDTLTLQSVTLTQGTGVAQIVDNQLLFTPGEEYNSLAVGESATAIVTYTISDGNGGTATSTATITIAGTNDQPVVEDVNVSDFEVISGLNTFFGTLQASDDDTSDTHMYQMMEESLHVDNEMVKDLSLVLNPETGEYTLQGDFNALAVGESAIVTFEYIANDTHGFDGTDGENESSTSEPATVTLTITGTNDAPILADEQLTGGVTEDRFSGQDDLPFVDLPPNGPIDERPFQDYPEGYEPIFDGPQPLPIPVPWMMLSDSGNIAFGDVDLNDEHTVSVKPLDESNLGMLFAQITEGNDGDGQGNVSWMYSVNNDSVQYLAQGEEKIETFEVTIDDGNGGTDTKTVTITITGTNDAPVLSSEVTSGAITEGDSSDTLTTTGEISFSDVDLSDTHTLSVSNVSSGTLGSLVANITEGNDGDGEGAITWTYSVNDADIQYLAQGETKEETFEITIDDGNGGTDTQTVTVTITGTNDVPEISGIDAGSIKEDTNTSGWFGALLSTSGKLDIVDIDNGESSFHPVTTIGEYGLFNMDTNGNWQYTALNMDSRIQTLGVGESLTDTFTVTSYDGSATQEVSITINGTNDVPYFIAGTRKGSVVEFSDGSEGENIANHTTAGSLLFNDTDINDTHTISVEPNGENYLGEFDAQIVKAATGSGLSNIGEINWSFEINDGSIDYLGQGEKLLQKYTVTIDDGNGGTDTKTVTITITGTNDAPVLSSEVTSGAITEGDSSDTLTTTGEISFSDVDLSDTHTLSVSNVSSGTLGSLVANITEGNDGDGEGAITWTYSVNDADIQYLAQGETKEETFEITIDDGNGGTDTKTVTVTITGTNDAPSVTVDSGNLNGANDTVYEAGLEGGTDSSQPIVATGTFTISDPDGLDDISSIVVAGEEFSVSSTDNFAAIVGEIISTPTHGDVKIESYDGNGQFTYSYTLDTAVANAADSDMGQDSFSVVVKDGALDDSASVEIDIVDDKPTVEAAGMDQSFSVTITNYDAASSAGYNSSFGYYIKGENGEPTSGVIIWDGVKAPNASATVTIDGYGPDDIGFFIIPNGNNKNGGLENNTEVTFQEVDGEWQAFMGGSQLASNSGHVLFDVGELNYDNGAYQYVVNNELPGNLNWEDIAGGGDKDNNDVNINADFTSGILSVDESNLDIDATADFSNAFTFNFGADGAGSKTFALSISAEGADSGLVDTATGENVTLHVNNGAIEGRADGEIVFTLSVDSDGKVTLDQQRAVMHGDTENPDDSVGLPAGLITLGASIEDSDSDSDSASIDIGSMIRFEDDGPVAFDDTNKTHEDAISVSGNVLANDKVGNDGLQEVSFQETEGTYGTLSFNAQTGEYTYTLNAHAQTLKEGQEVKEVFEYTLTDGDGDTDQGKLTITVEGRNDAPVIDLDGTTNVVYTESFEYLDGVKSSGHTIIRATSFEGDNGIEWTTEGGKKGLEVQYGGTGGSTPSDGDFHAELDSDQLVTLSTTVELTEGSATLTFDYKPRPGHVNDSDMKVTLGAETFTIKGNGSIEDGSDNINISVESGANGWMNVTVDLTHLPLGENTLSFEGLGSSNSFGAYLDNIELVGGIPGDADYETTYVENADPVSIADVDIAITDVDDTHMESATITLTNPQDDDVMVIDTEALPSGITATISEDGSIITLNGHATIADYESAIKAIGYYSTSENPSTENRLVSVQVNDGNDDSNTALTTVYVIPVNDAPVAVDDEMGTKEDEALVISASDLVPNDIDVDGDILNIVSVTEPDPAQGAITTQTDEFGNITSITFTPAHNYSGEATFTYTISDGELEDTATVTIMVDPVADTPVMLMSVGFNGGGEDFVVNGSFEDISGIDQNGDDVLDTDIPDGGLVHRIEIPGWKLDNEGNPIAYSLQGDGGASIGQTQLYDEKWYGIDGSGNADKPGVDKNETLQFDLNILATEATFELKGDPESDNFTAHWTAYDDDNNVVDSGTTSSSDLTIQSTTPFQYVSFDPHSTGNSQGNSFFVSPVSSTSSMPAMEPHHSDHAGVGTTDGDNYMDLGASPGNTAIYQEFDDLVQGETYQLEVDYRDKAAKQEGGLSGRESGVMQILWNGAVIATIDGDNKDEWETFTIEVTAIDGTNKLTFNEIGVADDYWGMAIDNVRLTGGLFEYDLHVTASVTDDSEILGDLVISGSTLPDGARLIYDGAELTAQGDLDGDGVDDYVLSGLESGEQYTIVLETTSRLSVEEINEIQGTITSIEQDVPEGSDASDDIASTTETALNEVTETDGVFEGTEGNDLIIGTEGNDAINGNGGNDTIDGNGGNDVIDGGEGEDTLIVDGESIDLSGLSNIETIDLQNGGEINQEISAQDVLDITDGDNDLHITGEGEVQVANEWENTGDETDPTVLEAVYSGDSANLIVDQTIDINPDIV
ncbi:MAG: VCBS domain-containing protein [Marichromatium sp.]|nr:VCBS domain-containing protein [Marichromatium sp.]